MIDDQELNEIMQILEDCSDESRAVALLREFNDKTSQWGRLFLNRDPLLPHDEWKKLCDKAEKELLDCVTKIRSLGNTRD
jgi:hypothetical protein